MATKEEKIRLTPVALELLHSEKYQDDLGVRIVRPMTRRPFKPCSCSSCLRKRLTVQQVVQ
jgi:hypothetical protein